MNQTITRSPRLYNPAPEQREAKKYTKPILIIILFIIMFSGLVYLVYYSNFFNIKNILVEGKSMPEIEKNVLGESIIFLDTNEVKKQIGILYPNVGEVSIIRGIPDTIKINVIEYEPKLVWTTNAQKYLVNNEGKVFRQFTEELDLPVIIDGKNLTIDLNQQVVSKTFIDFITDYNKKMLEDLNIEVLYYEIDSTIFQISAYTNQGWYLKLDTTRSSGEQVQALTELLKDHRGEISQYADLRVEGKVYYK